MTTLDAFRGVAAIFVVFRHSTEFRGLHDPTQSYLAVDLFFVMSGFVLSRGYSNKIAGGMSFIEFARRRLVRLYPLYLIGLFAGLSNMAWEVGHLSKSIIATAVTGLLLLPSPTWRFSDALFVELATAWSLFFELWVANILFALVSSRKNYVYICFAIAVVGFSALVVSEFYYGSLTTGDNWSTTPGGLARVLFAFFAGTLLEVTHRRGLAPFQSTPSWVLIAVLAASLSISFVGPLGQVVELAVVVICFPMLVLIGANASSSMPRIAIALGDLSYAVYILHLPLLIVFSRVLRWATIPYGALEQAAFIALVLAVGLLADKYVDAPLRRFLDASSRKLVNGSALALWRPPS